MKIIKNIIIAAMPILLLASCGKWLDVTPKAQVGYTKMFSSEQGFEDVLLGCYTSMTKKSLYGGNMTYGALDAMAQYYETDASTHIFNEMSKYIYSGETAKNVIDGIWLDSYYTIANCNVLLDNLNKANKNMFAKGHDVFIEAEAKAIRAFTHFNLLRLFAPSWNEGPDRLSIPFADTFQSTPFKQLTTKEVVALIIKDLVDGRELLRDVDPVFEEVFKENIYHFTQPVQDGRSDFINYRAYRMNYFAITATLARVYNYMGDKENAYKCAKEVIDHKSRFAFTKEGDFTGVEKTRDVNMINELLFCLSHPTVFKIFNFEFNNSTSSTCYVFGKDNIYPYADDLRKTYAFTKNKDNNKEYSLKFTELESGKGGKIPMIRISEMFFLAAECIFETDPELACSYVNEVKVNRGILVPLEPNMSYSDFVKEVTLEARREFIGEGLMFYRYKLLGGNVLRGGGEIEMKASQYTMPLPDTEIEFGDYKFE